MQEIVCKSRINDISELPECILAAWDELHQHVIDIVVIQWDTHLKAKGRHFEHKLL